MTGQQPATTGGEHDLELVGRLREASNATFLTRRGDELFVYKPVRGEAPLWDFPARTLGRREVAAHLLSAGCGFDVVPTTEWTTDAPLGEGSLQHWVEDTGDELVGLVLADELPEGWSGLVVGVDEKDRDLALVHADHTGLRRLALFDLVANNADRKGAHVLRAGEQVLGVDHGLTFHVETKLRTVLWGWAGEPFQSEEAELLARVVDRAPGLLEEWLSAEEVEATVERAEVLLAQGVFPDPPEDRYPIPWPPL